MQSAFTATATAQHPASSLTYSVARKAGLVLAASAFVAVCAHISLPLPFTAVPLTLQTFAVILVGMALGPVAGFCSMLLYLAEGAAGMPVFSPHGPGGLAQLLGPTAGYLFSYPLAAAIAGAVVRTTSNPRARFSIAILAGALASIPVFALGTAWLAFFLHLDTASAMHLAVTPFLFGEAAKVTAAAGIYQSIQRLRRA